MPTTDPPMGQPTTCRSCHAPIFWAVNERTFHAAPIDANPVATGNIIVTPGSDPPRSTRYRIATDAERANPAQVLWVSHYVTCPQADDWAKRKVAGVRPTGVER